MFESEHKLRHLPFFEEIASRAEGTAEWRSATAGVVVLRLVDAWLQDGSKVAADDAWGLRSVLAAIEEMDEGTPIRTLLGRVVDALRERKPDIHVVVTPLMAYGQALEYDAKWLLAADVYHSVLAHLHPVADGDASVAAHLRLGQCYRHLHMLEDASAAFTAASEIASEIGDCVGVLRARVGEARIAIVRGNLPHAERILDETIARAAEEDLSDVRSRALHERSNVAQIRGQYELAIQLAYEALGHAHAPTERDRILADIALTFMELGVFSAARDAYLVLSATAQEEYVRWAADLNLLEISSLTGSEMLFEQYRRRLVAVDLPPFLATAFQLNVGLGYQRFANESKARAHLQQALGLAELHGINQFLFDAEEALLQLDVTTPPQRAQREVPLDLEEVANAIRSMRDSVGVA